MESDKDWAERETLFSLSEDHFKEIGKLAVQSALFETRVRGQIALLLNISPSIMSLLLGRANIDRLLSILNGLWTARISDEDSRRTMLEIIKKARELFPKRGDIMHSAWFGFMGTPTFAARVNTGKKDADVFKETPESIRELGLAFMVLRHRFDMLVNKDRELLPVPQHEALDELAHELNQTPARDQEEL